MRLTVVYMSAYAKQSKFYKLGNDTLNTVSDLES